MRWRGTPEFRFAACRNFRYGSPAARAQYGAGCAASQPDQGGGISATKPCNRVGSFPIGFQCSLSGVHESWPVSFSNWLPACVQAVQNLLLGSKTDHRVHLAGCNPWRAPLHMLIDEYINTLAPDSARFESIPNKQGHSKALSTRTHPAQEPPDRLEYPLASHGA